MLHSKRPWWHPNLFPLAGLLGLLLPDLAGATNGERSPAAAGGHDVVYRLDAAKSSVRVLTGSSGAFGFLGHDHVIAVPSFTGEAGIDTTDLRRFALIIEAKTDSLRVIEEDDAGDRQKIENDMKEDVLQSPAFPTMTLRGVSFHPEGPDTTRVGGWGAHQGRLQLEITLHGVTKTVGVPLQLELDPNQLRARGKFTINHADFNLHRKKVAGVVNVAEELEIEYDVRGVAVRAEKP
jgi:polyisoprenoid-binding protein YceI